MLVICHGNLLQIRCDQIRILILATELGDQSQKLILLLQKQQTYYLDGTDDRLGEIKTLLELVMRRCLLRIRFHERGMKFLII